MDLRFSRRQTLGGVALGAAAAMGTRADAGEIPPASGQTSGDLAGGSPTSQPHGACTLFPQAVEGPYYLDPKLVRADITEGRPGLPIDLRLKLIEQGSCSPIANVRVDVWHADASGVYSGYAGQGDDRAVSTKGQTYLRGTQISDAEGNVVFQTIFPGWYPGRTPHIHIKAFLDKTAMLTGQRTFQTTSARAFMARKRPIMSGQFPIRPTRPTEFSGLASATAEEPSFSFKTARAA